ncbi:MAG: nuclear transport factor 2 family protein [Pseudomonadota bacterium]
MSAIETFFDAWALTDTGAQAQMIAGTLAPGATYSDPRSGGRLEGEAIAAYVSAFAANAPGSSATVENTSDVNGYLRIRVAFGGAGPDGAPMVQHGTYFADLDGDQIAMLAGFVGADA